MTVASSFAIDVFVEEARGVPIGKAAQRLNLKFRQGKHVEHPQPCPVKGGTDMFSFNTTKNQWNCRGCAAGGHDAIGMAAHCLGLDLKSRAQFLDACSVASGQPIPEDGERESDDERADRQARLERQRADNAAAEEKRAANQVDFREKERRRARGIVAAAQIITALPYARDYLRGRGCLAPAGTPLRVSAEQTYWHGEDERGQPLALYSGPAMVAPFIDRDLAVIGCHLTWIDLENPPKFRPLLFGLTKKGFAARLPDWRFGDPPPSPADLAAELYDILPTKKMRGSKKGGLIPLCGDPSSRRWVGGEGNENGLAFGGWEGFRDDTFYFAAGDLGNLAGPADAVSRFAHPTLTKPDKNGALRPVMVAGPVPKIGQADDDAMWVGDHVDELVFLADGDSEPVFTAAAMARAKARHARPGRLTPVVWPPRGLDFSALAKGDR